MVNTIQGSAVIRSSNRRPQDDGKLAEDRDYDDGLWGELREAVGGILYEFGLEVTIPGEEPYETRARSRVPAKAEKINFFTTHPIPLTLEVPVVVQADDRAQVRIDWSAFLARPDKTALLLAARERALVIAAERQRAANPAQSAAMLAQSETVLLTWANSVRHGGMTRQQLVDSAQALVRLGHMRQEDLDRTLADLDG